MSKYFKLEIVTPDKTLFSGDVEIVVAPIMSDEEGFPKEEGFMANHIWICKLLDTGVIRLREPGSKEHRLANVSGGFIDFHGDALVFSDTAEWIAPSTN